MIQKDLFAMALGLQGTLWYVADVRFDRDHMRLEIGLDFPPGSRFPHSDSGEHHSTYDCEHRIWWKGGNGVRSVQLTN